MADTERLLQIIAEQSERIAKALEIQNKLISVQTKLYIALSGDKNNHDVFGVNIKLSEIMEKLP